MTNTVSDIKLALLAVAIVIGCAADRVHADHFGVTVLSDESPSYIGADTSALVLPDRVSGL